MPKNTCTYNRDTNMQHVMLSGASGKRQDPPSESETHNINSFNR